MSLPSKDMMAAIAATRFGLGARPGEIEATKSDPQGFLTAQIRRDGAYTPPDDGETSAARFAQMREYQQQKKMERDRKDGQAPASVPPVKAARRDLRDKVNDDFLARAPGRRYAGRLP